MWISEIEGTKHETNKNWIQKLAAHLFQKHVTSKNKWLKLGRANVDISDELEKQLRLKTVERFGGKKATYPRLSKKRSKHWSIKNNEAVPPQIPITTL